MGLMIFLAERDLTVLTDNLSVCVTVMLLLLALWDYIAACRALVVHAGAPDLMHPVLALLDLSLASATLLCRFGCRASFHYCLKVYIIEFSMKFPLG